MKTISICLLLSPFVLCHRVRTEIIQRLNQAATLEAVQVNVSTKIAGQVLRIFVEEGSTVHLGDTIAQLDHATLDLQL